MEVTMLARSCWLSRDILILSVLSIAAMLVSRLGSVDEDLNVFTSIVHAVAGSC
jgi:hypothetical protein